MRGRRSRTVQESPDELIIMKTLEEISNIFHKHKEEMLKKNKVTEIGLFCEVQR